MSGTPLAKTTRHVPAAKTVRHAPIAKEASTSIMKVVQHLEAGEWQSAHTLVKGRHATGCWAHGLVQSDRRISKCQILVSPRARAAAARQPRRRRNRGAEVVRHGTQ